MIYYNFILSNYADVKPLKINGYSCNASKIDDKYISRSTNYTFLNPYFKHKYNLGRHLWFDKSIWTDEKLYNLDFSFVKDISKSNEHFKQASGDEDFRIIKWNNENYGIYSRVIIPFRKNEVHFCKFSSNYDVCEDKKIITKEQTEKNWQPIETIPFKCVYSYKPFKIINLNNSNFELIPNNIVTTNYRGSTQIIKFNDYNLGIVHERKEEGLEHYYIHYFILFDKNMNLLKISKPFSFFGADIEFCTYLNYNNGNITILMSVNDQISFEFSIPDTIIYDIFEEKLNDCNKNKRMYENFYTIAKNNNNINAAICLATFCNDKDIIEEAIKLNFNCKLSEDKKILLQKILIEKYRGI